MVKSKFRSAAAAPQPINYGYYKDKKGQNSDFLPANVRKVDARMKKKVVRNV